MSLTLNFRVNAGPVAEFTVKSAEPSISDVTEALLSAGPQTHEFNCFAVRYLNDVIDLGACDGSEKLSEVVDVTDDCTFFLLQRPKRVTPDESELEDLVEIDDDEVESRFKGLNARNIASKLNSTTDPKRLATMLAYCDEYLPNFHEYKPFLRDLSLSSLTAILKRDTLLSLQEIEIFQLFYNWTIHHPDVDAKTINDLSLCVRFPLLTLEELSNQVCNAEVLDPKDLIDLIVYASLVDSEKEQKVKPEPNKKWNSVERHAVDDDPSVGGGGGKSIKFKSKENHPEGIFQYIGKIKDKNNWVNPVPDLVTIDSPGCYSFPQSQLKGGMLVDRSYINNTSASFATQSGGGKTPVVIKFLKHAIKPSAYYIHCAYSGYDPKHWRVEGCLTSKGDKWVTISEVSSATNEDIKGKIHKCKSSGFYKQLRICWDYSENPSQFVLNHLEFSGNVKQKN